MSAEIKNANRLDELLLAVAHEMLGDDAGLKACNEQARRIIVCFNACAGIPTEALENKAVAEAFAILEELVKGRPYQKPPPEASRAHANWVLFERSRKVLAHVA